MTVGTPKSPWLSTDVLTDVLLNAELRDQLIALFTRPQGIYTLSADYTTTSVTPTYVDVNSAVKVTATAERANAIFRVRLTATISLSIANYIWFRLDVDGTPTLSNPYKFAGAGDAGFATYEWWIPGLGAGLHTFKPQWTIGAAGTGTIYGATSWSQLTCIEVGLP